MASSTGRFPLYLFVAWQWKRSLYIAIEVDNDDNCMRISPKKSSADNSLKQYEVSFDKEPKILQSGQRSVQLISNQFGQTEYFRIRMPLAPFTQKRKAIRHAVFYYSEELFVLLLLLLFFFMSVGFADVSGLIFERMGQTFSRSNFFVKFVFLSIQFDSLTRWLMIPWQERLILVLFLHRVLYIIIIRDGPLEKLWGWGRGIFELQEFFSLNLF